VAVTDVIDGEGQQVAEEIRQADAQAEFWHLDVTEENEVREVIESVTRNGLRLRGPARLTEPEGSQLRMNVAGPAETGHVFAQEGVVWPAEGTVE
jgi:NAD(P)-dependent dehydrogenase (short-subunit alcohol dehydrogenase family)